MTQTARILAFIGSVGADIKSLTTGKEPTITAGTSAQFWLGNKTWATIITTVLGVVLTGLSTATSTAVVATDTILVAIGKLQAQITLRQNLNPAIKLYNASSNTMVLTDNGTIVTMNHATAGTATSLTVPQNSVVAFPIGCSIPVVQLGTGQNTIVAGTNTILIAPNGLKNRVQGSTLFLMKVAINTWVVGGDTAI